jgi:hypothetical protein
MTARPLSASWRHDRAVQVPPVPPHAPRMVLSVRNWADNGEPGGSEGAADADLVETFEH